MKDLFRFIHIGDAHLGPNARNVDRRKAIDEIIAREINQPVSAWLWPGDLNHGRMTIEDRNFLKDRLKRMADHAPVLICYGNHDLPGDLDIFADLHTVWPIIVRSMPGVVLLPTRQWPVGTAHVGVYVLPYPTKAGLVAAGVPHEQLIDAARAALEALFIAGAAELEQLAPDMPRLMIGHVNVAGSITSVGQPNIGREIEVDEALLNRFGRIYKGLNHIHKGQRVANAFYPGSICRLDWGETEPKRYLVVECFHKDTVDLGTGVSGCEGMWAWHVREIPLDVAPMYHVEGELTRDGFTWRVTKGLDGPTDLAPMSWEGCEVRVRYRYSATEKSALDETLVRAPFEGAKRIDVDPIAMRQRAVRAPEVAAAVTLEAKVEAFVEMSGIDWTPTLAAKLSLVQQVHADEAAFVAAVRQELSGTKAVVVPPRGQSPRVPDIIPFDMSIDMTNPQEAQ